jgi:hypothetical protein
MRSVCNGQCDRYGNEQCCLKKGRPKHQDIRDGFIVVARDMLDACRFVENHYAVVYNTRPSISDAPSFGHKPPLALRDKWGL